MQLQGSFKQNLKGMTKLITLIITIVMKYFESKVIEHFKYILIWKDKKRFFTRFTTKSTLQLSQKNAGSGHVTS